MRQEGTRALPRQPSRSELYPPIPKLNWLILLGHIRSIIPGLRTPNMTEPVQINGQLLRLPEAASRQWPLDLCFRIKGPHQHEPWGRSQ